MGKGCSGRSRCHCCWWLFPWRDRRQQYRQRSISTKSKSVAKRSYPGFPCPSMAVDLHLEKRAMKPLFFGAVGVIQNDLFDNQLNAFEFFHDILWFATEDMFSHLPHMAETKFLPVRQRGKGQVDF